LDTGPAELFGRITGQSLIEQNVKARCCAHAAGVSAARSSRLAAAKRQGLLHVFWLQFRVDLTQPCHAAPES
jgi:hypothetical protein